MLRVTTIYASSAVSAAAYYTRYLAEAPGEVPGVWAGKQAGALGLCGDVEGGDLLALLEGRDPISGSPLGRAMADRVLADGKVVRAVAGFDATFSAPKSVSVLWALTQDERVLYAHDAAVRAALAHLERFGSTTRVRVRGGRLHPDSQGLSMAVFRQTTSRADDPQLHTHAVISAKVRTDDGRWLALDARYLKGYQRMLGGLYQSVLRNELTHGLGVVWEPIEHGQAELLGVPTELREVFSKRTAQVDQAVAALRAEFVARQGREPNRWETAAITRQAAADTRGRKSGDGVAELVTRWADEAAEIGWTGPDLLTAVTGTGRAPPSQPTSLDVGEVVAALSTGGSTWNRAHIVSAVCDNARANPDLDAVGWAELLEHVTDRIVERCVELDPADTAGPRRGSDGRSMWLEPTSPHITTETILAEEELVLAWALEAQTQEPTRSTTVDTRGLDVLQGDAAAAVAGLDRLVIVVGPAGAGKTTTLRAAIDDLDDSGRVVFGVAPSAKAARVLESETGVAADTLAKLLHEWDCGDRPPEPRYQLPPDATVLVDEAGMVSTPALARLVTLAEQQLWRVVLVGDPYQLQAVGRGGLFAELCATGRHALQRIHRFEHDWEAAASLLLRYGDPAGWDPYLEHDRIIPGSFDEHLATAAQHWLTTTAAGGSVSVVASTNAHVDALNAHIQHARVEHGDLDPTLSAAIGGGERAMIGDVVVTRRNNRQLFTSRGEPIRNRELWTVTAIGSDGSLTVTANIGHGTAELPADYVRQHVRLGYAATEHGVQGDTTTIGIELASPATTRRGAYVGITRGQHTNLMLVITDNHDLDDARDILDRIITSDRADIPATSQRHQLATLDHHPSRPPQPRSPIPDRLPELRSTIRHQLDAAHQQLAEHQHRQHQLAQQLTAAEHDLQVAHRRYDPYRPAIDAAAAAVGSAQQQLWAASHTALHSKGRQRRTAHRQSRHAQAALALARQQHEQATAAGAPAWAAVTSASNHVRQIGESIKTAVILEHMDRAPERLERLHALSAAVDDWQRWATGQPITNDGVTTIATVLRQRGVGELEQCQALAATIEVWARHAGIDVGVPAATSPQVGIER